MNKSCISVICSGTTAESCYLLSGKDPGWVYGPSSSKLQDLPILMAARITHSAKTALSAGRVLTPAATSHKPLQQLPEGSMTCAVKAHQLQRDSNGCTTLQLHAATRAGCMQEHASPQCIKCIKATGHSAALVSKCPMQS